MDARFNNGTIVYRTLTEKEGLLEIQHTFNSIDELFALVLEAKDPYLVDRISMTGVDERGKKRVVAFVFQSVTMTEG